MRSYCTPYQILRPKRRTYRDDILKPRAMGRPMICSSVCKMHNKYTKWVKPSRNNQHWEDFNCAINNRTNKGGGSTSPSNPEKVCADRRKRKYADRLSNDLNAEKTCMLHGPGHSMKEFKVLRDHSKKHAGQRLTNKTTKAADKREVRQQSSCLVTRRLTKTYRRRTVL